MASSPLSRLTTMLEPILKRWQETPLSVRVTSIFTATSLWTLIASYRDWKSLGPGGFPHNLKGYSMNLYLIATTAYWDTIGLDFYERTNEQWKAASGDEKKAAKKSYLDVPLPVREGKRARAKKWIVPQRQNPANNPIDPIIKETYFAKLNSIATTHSSTTSFRTSIMEKHGRALFSQSPPPSLASQTRGEICHIHTSDLSAHVTLSFTDAREVISKGWGERHRLSGTKYINPGYTMLYAPRNAEEVEVLGRVLEAGVRYMQTGV